MAKYCLLIVTLTLIVNQLVAQHISIRIPVESQNIFNESGLGNAQYLFDEQHLVKQASQTPSAQAHTTWETGFQASIPYPCSAYIDLGENFRITKIIWYDTNGEGKFTLSSGIPGNWIPFLSDPLKGYNHWKTFQVNCTTRFLRISRETPTSNVAEIFLYGFKDEKIARNVVPKLLPDIPEKQIKLFPSMLINESGVGEINNLIDEQLLPAKNKLPATTWSAGFEPKNYPLTCVIDLQEPVFLEKIWLMSNSHRSTGYEPFELYEGRPIAWKKIVPLSKGNPVTQYILHKRARYLRIKVKDAKAYLSEILLFGEQPILKNVKSDHHSTHRTTMDQLIGVNSFIDIPLGWHEVAGFVREYHNWMWNDGMNDSGYPGYPDNQLHFQTGLWDFDRYYQNLKKLGITICPVIQNSVPWLFNFIDTKINDKPVLAGKNPEDPQSYAAHADFLYQFAARYGSSQVPDQKLKVAAEELSLSGLACVDYLENWNEPDKWWHGRGARFSPYEYAAMSSADYDGHLSQMGANKGMNNADQNMKMAMGGLALPSLDYLKALKFWCDHNRKGNFPFQAINLHFYCNNGTQQQVGNKGISPEAARMAEQLKEFVDYRNQFLPEVEVWLTEFGYDTHTGSPQAAPAFPPFSAEEVQAIWLVRSYLACAAAGIDKAAMYMLADTPEGGANRFNTSGLLKRENESFEPKPSWFYIHTLKEHLSGMIFDTQVKDLKNGMIIQTYRHPEKNLTTDVVWLPDDKSGRNIFYQNVPKPDQFFFRTISFANGKKFGELSKISAHPGSVSLKAGEKPILIEYTSDKSLFPSEKKEEKIELSEKFIISSQSNTAAGFLIDEQENLPDLRYQLSTPALTPWKPGYNTENYPADAVFDLGSQKEITKIYLFDRNGKGKVSLSFGQPGHWEEVAVNHMQRFNQWVCHVINRKTRYLKITQYEPDANVGEIVVYGKPVL